MLTSTDPLIKRIAAALRSQLSPRHIPDRIVGVHAIPRTLTGKKLEAPVKRILRGEPADRVASRGSLLDPTALDDFVADRQGCVADPDVSAIAARGPRSLMI